MKQMNGVGNGRLPQFTYDVHFEQQDRHGTSSTSLTFNVHLLVLVAMHMFCTHSASWEKARDTSQPLFNITMEEASLALCSTDILLFTGKDLFKLQGCMFSTTTALIQSSAEHGIDAGVFVALV